MALTSLFEGISPEEFTGQVRDVHGDRAQHPTLARPLRRTVYQPMLELIDELQRSSTVTVTIVTGGGTEFVRAVSQELYGVPPEAVVGHPHRVRATTAATDGARACSGRRRLVGEANEGAAKVSNIQTPARPTAAPCGRQLRRRPGDARVGGGRRRARPWRCWSTTTTPSGSSAT